MMSSNKIIFQEIIWHRSHQITPYRKRLQQNPRNHITGSSGDRREREMEGRQRQVDGVMSWKEDRED